MYSAHVSFHRPWKVPRESAEPAIEESTKRVSGRHGRIGVSIVTVMGAGNVL
jgi:hypothetical protein